MACRAALIIQLHGGNRCTEGTGAGRGQGGGGGRGQGGGVHAACGQGREISMVWWWCVFVCVGHPNLTIPRSVQKAVAINCPAARIKSVGMHVGQPPGKTRVSSESALRTGAVPLTSLHATLVPQAKSSLCLTVPCLPHPAALACLLSSPPDPLNSLLLTPPRQPAFPARLPFPPLSSRCTQAACVQGMRAAGSVAHLSGAL